MITISLLVDHVKARLGVSHRQIELSDDAIMRCLLDTTLKTISIYAPHYGIVFLNLRNNQVMEGMNTYYIPTEYGDMFDLMSVEQILPTSAQVEEDNKKNTAANNQAQNNSSSNISITTSTPFNTSRMTSMGGGFGGGAINYNFLPSGGDLQATISSLVSMRMGSNMGGASSNPFTFDYLPPNMVRLNTPIASGNVAMVVRTTHKKDFTTIPFGMMEAVKDLAFYDVAMDIFSIRKYFANVRTLFAEINLDMDFYNNIPDKRTELIERLRKNQLKYSHTRKIYIY